MADSKALVASESTWSPEFIQELLPSAERTALLYHLAFLCLGNFPKLERMIRHEATETQMLFGTSEAVLMQCAGTSSNLVTSLFPMLKVAVEKNKPILAVKYLEKARTWINDLIKAVDDMVKRYDKQALNVQTCTSDVYQEQRQTEDKLTKHTDEMKRLEEALARLEPQLNKTVKDMEEIEKRMEKINQELCLLMNTGYYINVLFFRMFISQRSSDHPEVLAKRAELTPLIHEKNVLQKQEWDIKIQQIDLQLKLANSKIQLGAIPSAFHLKEVQQSLDQIRQILVHLKKFWEKVAVMLNLTKDKTFIGEDLIDLDDFKEWFLDSIDEAKKDWQTFGEGCQRAQNIFSVQSKDAYKFLEVNPSSLSQHERDVQYASITEKLRKVNEQYKIRAAITA